MASVVDGLRRLVQFQVGAGKMEQHAGIVRMVGEPALHELEGVVMLLLPPQAAGELLGKF